VFKLQTLRSMPHAELLSCRYFEEQTIDRSSEKLPTTLRPTMVYAGAVRCTGDRDELSKGKPYFPGPRTKRSQKGTELMHQLIACVM